MKIIHTYNLFPNFEGNQTELLHVFGLNSAYMKIRKPNLSCTDNTLFFRQFYGFLRFVVWTNNGHFCGV